MYMWKSLLYIMYIHVVMYLLFYTIIRYYIQFSYDINIGVVCVCGTVFSTWISFFNPWTD